MFSALEAGAHADHPDLQYSVQCPSGVITQGVAYPRKVRTFNADFVEANVGGCEGPIPHVLIVGEENKALAAELVLEQAAVLDRTRAIAAAETAITKLETERGKLFSAIAKTIGEATSGATLRSYRRPNAEAAYAKMTTLAQLETEAFERHRATVKQDEMEAIEVFGLPPQLRQDGPPSYDTALTVDLEDLLGSAGRLEAVTTRHNEKCASFEAEKDAARTALESHYLSSISDQVIAIDAQIGAQRKLISTRTGRSWRPATATKSTLDFRNHWCSAGSFT